MARRTAARLLHRVLVYVLLVAWGAGCAPALAPTVADPAAIAWEDRTVYAAGLVGSERQALDQLHGATVYHIDLTLPDDLTILEGREEVRYTNCEARTLKELYLHLVPNHSGGKVTIASLAVDGTETAFEAVFEETAIRVPLTPPLAPNDAITLRVDFRVEVPREMGGKYGLFGYFEDVLVLDTFYPAVAAYHGDGWQVQPPSHIGHPFHLDAAYYLVRVTAPTRLTLVTTGSEVGRKALEDRQVRVFAAGPARDFYLAASEHYIRVSRRVGETTVNSYAMQDRRDMAKQVLSSTVLALERFNARFGPYPYTEMDILSTPMRALGVMYPGAMGISLTLYQPEGRVGDVPAEIYLEATIAHEVAHQWFGNVVGFDWADETWLGEGLAQYGAWLYYLDVRGSAAADGFRQSWFDRWDRIGRKEIPLGLPAQAYAEDEYGPIIYGRSPLFLTALAEEMGASAFDAALRAYVDAQRWEITDSQTFRAAAEGRCDCDLSALYRSWVMAGEG